MNSALFSRRWRWASRRHHFLHDLLRAAFLLLPPRVVDGFLHPHLDAFLESAEGADVPGVSGDLAAVGAQAALGDVLLPVRHLHEETLAGVAHGGAGGGEEEDALNYCTRWK